MKKRNQNGLSTVFHYGPNGELLFEKDQAVNTKEYVWLTAGRWRASTTAARSTTTILHNQRALMLKGALLFKERVILMDVPFHLTR